MRAIPKPRGFTMVELAIVLAIVSVILVTAFAAFRTTRQRSEASATSLDLRALIHQARSEALATGHDVAVLVFPDLANPGGGTGRVVVYSDGDRSFFTTAAALNFDNYDPRGTGSPPAANSETLGTIDLPRNFRFGPATGQAPRTLSAPYAGLPVNLDCTFCLGNGVGGRRGAIVFNYQGVARFHSATGAPAGPLAGAVGGSMTFQSADVTTELRTLAVVAATGAVRSIQFQLP